MKNLRTHFGLLVFGISTLLSGTASAQLVNGSFEAGTGSWTLVESVVGACRMEAVVHPGNSTGFAGFPTVPPTNGTAELLSDATNPATCTLFQDVVVPADINTLTYAAGYRWFDAFAGAGPGPGGCSAVIGVADTLGNPIATGFTASGGSTVAFTAQPTLTFGAPAGSTVRVAIQVTHCAGGPVGIIADNFVLAAFTGTTQIPATSQWGLLILALLLAGAAVPMIRARTRR